jgi:hypothetical protein
MIKTKHCCPSCLTDSGECIEVIHVSDNKRIVEYHLRETLHCTKCGWVGTWPMMKKVSIEI